MQEGIFSVQNQIKKLNSVFNGIISETEEKELLGKALVTNYKETHVQNLLIIPPDRLPTKMIFSEIDLGKKDANTWFLSEEKIGGFERKTDKPYFLIRVDVANCNRTRDGGHYVNLHEGVLLLFYFPQLISGFAQGIQTLGSSFEEELGSYQTLELYRKGNAGEAFLKLAKEKHAYWDYSKLIPKFDEIKTC